MSDDIGIPLGAAFYKELAFLAWKSLSEEQQNQMRQFLVLRFVDASPDALNRLVTERAKACFNSLCENGDFDEDLKAVLGEVVTEQKLRACVEDLVEVESGLLPGRVRQLLAERWQEWIDSPEEFIAKVNVVVDSVLASEKLDKQFAQVLRSHLSKAQLNGLLNRHVGERVKAWCDEIDNETS